MPPLPSSLGDMTELQLRATQAEIAHAALVWSEICCSNSFCSALSAAAPAWPAVFMSCAAAHSPAAIRYP